jgi:hypothetical protein
MFSGVRPGTSGRSIYPIPVGGSLHLIQGDHFSGKPGNVRDFGYCQGNVRDYDKSQGSVGEFHNVWKVGTLLVSTPDVAFDNVWWLYGP